ncbi:3'-5' exonuclease [Salinibacter grassmerensis]|uniref:3'-5' exonuclease n=1 Tax=Salinibacter grassmerensis TaxID=3040353 RepID=UPI0021E9A9AC|nr:3'-5' exonuclease [Salinibacter grassmerensis]
MLSTDRPLAVLDLEATSADPASARIIQVAVLRLVESSGSLSLGGSFETLVNPGVPIPAEVSDLTGITNQMVETAPPFEELGEDLQPLIQDAHLAGYNSLQYDLPLLKAEFRRHGLGPLPGPDDRVHLDVMRLEETFRGKSLGDVFQKYFGDRPEEAHTAMADVRSTCKVLKGQLQTYEPERDVRALAQRATGSDVDRQGRLKRSGGEIVLAFGKHEGTPLERLQEEEPGYFEWMYEEMEALRPHLDPFR